LLPKNYFAGILEQNSTYEGVIRKRSCFEGRSVELEVGCSAMIKKACLQNLRT